MDQKGKHTLPERPQPDKVEPLRLVKPGEKRRTIIFKKQLLGQWRRDDGEFRKTVNDEAMYREITKLVADGWEYKIWGLTHVRMIEVYKIC